MLAELAASTVAFLTKRQERSLRIESPCHLLRCQIAGAGHVKRAIPVILDHRQTPQPGGIFLAKMDCISQRRSSTASDGAVCKPHLKF
jgi:hypothetical protein